MSEKYYGVEPYSGKIICHYGTRKGIKWGYSKGELVNPDLARTVRENHERFAKGFREWQARNEMNKKAQAERNNYLNRRGAIDKDYYDILNSAVEKDSIDRDVYKYGFDPKIEKRKLKKSLGKGSTYASGAINYGRNIQAQAERNNYLNRR